jgi:hypothetical protein
MTNDLERRLSEHKRGHTMTTRRMSNLNWFIKKITKVLMRRGVGSYILKLQQEEDF